ncbi:MAG: CopG family transcriptional regulator [Candidatus Margulisbacteria bacterium]|jgi:hypothetical protein|nr:CopG family transcriptional regulator [Candidatus Margulisiibacteriota bacterium]
MKASEFDKKFESGEDMFPYLDLSSARRPNRVKRINVDIPTWMINSLDREAVRLGVTRQSVIKFWLADHISSAA